VLPVLVPQRDQVRQRLEAAGVGTNIHYPIACHQQPPFARFASGPLPVVEDASQCELSLPMFPHLGDDGVRYICEALQVALVEERSLHA
jgi:dTDP-4-amino-4,6-dideoxygalactose transaminase